jgi:hypothetical protein
MMESYVDEYEGAPWRAHDPSGDMDRMVWRFGGWRSSNASMNEIITVLAPKHFPDATDDEIDRALDKALTELKDIESHLAHRRREKRDGRPC